MIIPDKALSPEEIARMTIHLFSPKTSSKSTLILHGKQDILIPPENGSILAKAIPNAKLVYFENSAHELIEENGRSD